MYTILLKQGGQKGQYKISKEFDTISSIICVFCKIINVKSVKLFVLKTHASLCITDTSIQIVFYMQ